MPKATHSLTRNAEGQGRTGSKSVVLTIQTYGRRQENKRKPDGWGPSLQNAYSEVLCSCWNRVRIGIGIEIDSDFLTLQQRKKEDQERDSQQLLCSKSKPVMTEIRRVVSFVGRVLTREVPGCSML